MRKSATVTLLLLACAISYGREGVAQSQSPTDAESTLRVNVKLVNVYVTVTDAHGAPVAGLKKENFVVQEDGREQKVSVFDKESALPISIALALGTRLSPRHDLAFEQGSGERFVREIVRAGDGLSVFSFS